MNKTASFRLPLLALIGVLCLFVPPYLNRELWFDEALTVLNFALMESPVEIYRNYVIPNNQILYTILIHYWIKLQPGFLPADWWLRLPSLLCAAGVLSSLYLFFRVQIGSWPLFLALLALAVSPPFLIYATAVRAYMLSLLLVVFALKFALDFAATGRKRAWCWYALFSLLSLGCIPSNLAALAGVVLYALPDCGGNFLRRGRFWMLAATPPAALAIFYLPILRNFIGVAKLGEGWSDGMGVLQALLSAGAYIFAMLLLPAAGTFFAFARPHFNWLRSSRAMIWLLPIPAALLLPTAPFPRVFIPMTGLYTLLIASGIRDFSALNIRRFRRWSPSYWFGGLTVLVLVWGFIGQREELRGAFSRRNGGAGGDDFFYGYYLRPEFQPSRTVAELAELTAGQPALPPVYSSLSADPWPLLFYAGIRGLDLSHLRFDGPRGPVPGLEDRSLVITRSDESSSALENRFGGTLTLLAETPFHRIYRFRVLAR